MPGPEQVHPYQKGMPQTPSELPKKKQGGLKNELEQLKQECMLDFTLAVLSHIQTDNMKELKIHPRKDRHGHGHGHLPGRVSFDYVLGIDPNDDEKTKDRKAIEVRVNWFEETVDRLWGRQLNQVSKPKERQIITMCQKLEEKGINKERALSTVREHYGLQIRDKSTPFATLP